MNKFLKVLGAAALIAGLTPYKVENDKEAGTWSVKALLWQASRTPTDDPGKDDINFNFGFSAPQKEEADLFSDELTVNYGEFAEELEKDVEEAAEEAAEEAMEDLEKDVEEAAEEIEKDMEEAAEEIEQDVQEAAEETEEP